MYKTKVNNSEYDISLNGNEFNINDEKLDWDIIAIDNNRFHIIYQNKSYNAEFIGLSEDKKQVKLKIENEIFNVDVKDKFEQLLDKLGMSNLTTSKVNDIKAPMPGLILSINVSIGDEVKKGDTVMILEAMKMENVLKSPGEGIITAIMVKEGDSVEKNTILIKF